MKEWRTGVLTYSWRSYSGVFYLEEMEQNQGVHGFHLISFAVGDPHEDATHRAHVLGKADQVFLETVAAADE